MQERDADGRTGPPPGINGEERTQQGQNRLEAGKNNAFSREMERDGRGDVAGDGRAGAGSGRTQWAEESPGSRE